MAKWAIPDILDLGEFPANSANSFLMNIEVEEDCDLLLKVSGLSLFPKHIQKGLNTVSIITQPISENIHIWGYINIITQNSSIHKSTNAALHLKNDNSRHIMVKGTSLALPHGYYDNKVIYDSVGKFQIEQPDNKILQKGQNIPVNNLLNTEISLNFDYLSNNLSLSIVPYAFILNENDAVANSDGFVYPNTSSPEDAVYCTEKEAKIKLNLLPKETKKVIIVYTISGTENLENLQNNLNFNKIHLPNLKIMAENELYYNFPLKIDDSSTLIAVEFYQTHNGWRLNAVGAEYNAPFSELCAECGIKIKK